MIKTILEYHYLQFSVNYHGFDKTHQTAFVKPSFDEKSYYRDGTIIDSFMFIDHSAYKHVGNHFHLVYKPLIDT